MESEVGDMKIQRIDHIGIIVDDLAAAKAFFLDLGLEVLAEWEVEGEPVVERVIGLDNVKNAAVMLGVPGGPVGIELVKFITPADEGGVQQLPSNALGIRHISFEVDDLEAIVASLKAKGTEIFSEIQYLGGYKLCYIRGPEGIILELAEQT
jgi:catechol 2,3-dioxygenase-like lactoylglutathione lyase family enzyme